ncbi:MAG TPA: pyruvate kinase [Fastidiosipila sp.]|nr:pyruvate kinase [Fastidiosipila sp.]
MRKTKIVCTIGPAVDEENTLKLLMEAGMDVARLNFSHGTLEEHKARIERIKKVRNELNLPIPIILDTKGPEIRTGLLEQNPTELSVGDRFTLYTEEKLGNKDGVSVTYPYLNEDVSVGTHILIDDGLIELIVEAIDGNDVITSVLNGGPLGNRKSINLPNTATRLPSLSDKDIADIEFGVKHEVDFIAASFVRNGQAIDVIRDILADLGAPEIRIIAKIENQEGLDNIEEILDRADALMVARGDMGVEIPMEQVPAIQKELIRMCYMIGKPCITATQMLDSMMRNPRPTRAEVSDVANAIIDGTSAIMLSGETAAGLYPIEAVKTMDRVALATETTIDYWDQFDKETYDLKKNVSNAISHAACITARDLDAKAIVPMTYSGDTARLISRFRPDSPILAFTVSPRSQRQLNLSWGVTPALIDVVFDTDAVFEQGIRAAQSLIDLHQDDILILAGGTPVGMSGTTNAIKVHVVDENEK